jgi:hypothetical protein
MARRRVSHPRPLVPNQNNDMPEAARHGEWRSGAARLMGQVWLDAATVRVVREAPAASAGGKILHVVGR